MSEWIEATSEWVKADDPKPRDLRTCTQRPDEAIAELQMAIKARLFIDLEVVDEINDLRARVAALEAEQNAMIPTLSDEVGRLRARVAALEAAAPVTVPILGSVTWDTSAIRWTRGATPGGWRKVWDGTPQVTP